MRWGIPEQAEIADYEIMSIVGTSVYIHHAINGTANARIDAVTGGVGTKLVFLGFVGWK